MNERKSQNHSSRKTMKRINQPLKDVELRIVAELMKNSRRSDREIAKAVGVSQPTVSRIIEKLERSGVIREYTIIPDFTRLGYNVMGATQFELREESYEKRAEARSAMIDKYGGLIAVEGIDGGKNRLFVNFYEDYSKYVQAMRFLQAIPIVNVDNVETFLVDLNGPSTRILSMSAIANLLLKRLDKEGAKP